MKGSATRPPNRRWLSWSLCLLLLSHASTRINVYKGDLPWMSQHRMILVVVRPSGECVRRDVVIGDPPPGGISLNPDESLSGDINLTAAFKDLHDDIRRSELHLFWAYESPKVLGQPRWS